jgi:hypothetical protein
MRNLRIDGLIADPVFAPIFVKLGNRLDRRLGEDTAPAGVIEDIDIRNVRARSVGPYVSSITGYPGHPVRRVRLDNIHLSHEGGLQEDDVLTEVPERSDRYPEMNMFTKRTEGQLPAHGLYARHVSELSLRDLRVRLRNPDARRMLWFADVVDDPSEE